MISLYAALAVARIKFNFLVLISTFYPIAFAVALTQYSPDATIINIHCLCFANVEEWPTRYCYEFQQSAAMSYYVSVLIRLHNAWSWQLNT